MLRLIMEETAETSCTVANYIVQKYKMSAEVPCFGPGSSAQKGTDGHDRDKWHRVTKLCAHTA